jgi:PadR family transcriptional regulator PadR
MGKTGQQGELVQGTLDLLVLRTLARGDNHGWGISQAIHLLSGEVLRVEEGSLYPALHRLELRGLVTAEWGQSENKRRARIYRLTAKGRRQLEEERTSWRRLAQAIARVLEAS